MKAGLVPPGSLLKAVKGLFGVPEAPRLWFLEVIEKAVASGFERVPGFPCVLVCRDALGKFGGMIALHVDDGIMTGEGPQWDTFVKSLFSKLRFKHHRVKNLEYLKRRIVRRKGGSIDVRFDNVSAIRPIELTKQRRAQQDDAVSAEERTSLRSLLGEMQWPVREGFPEHAYDVSDLQQRVQRRRSRPSCGPIAHFGPCRSALASGLCAFPAATAQAALQLGFLRTRPSTGSPEEAASRAQ